MTKQTEEHGSEKGYPLSLAETRRLVKKVNWQGFHKVPQGFDGGGFYGSVGNTNVLLSGEYVEMTASFESASRLYREKVCLANYQHKEFREIWGKLVEGEKQDVQKQKKSLLDKLKTLASA